MSTTTDHPVNLVIRASAGTGKTFALSNRFIDLLHREVPVDRILATTFTRKAAGEILDRILYRLARAATDDAYRNELAGFIEGSSLSRDDCLTLLENAVGHLHRMRIGTLDSFFAQIAGTFSLELGLPPGWRICDETEDERLRTDAIESVLRGGVAKGKVKKDLARLTHLLTKGEARRGIHQLIRDVVNNLYSLYLETDADAWKRLSKPKSLSASELAATLEDLRTVDLPEGKRFAGARDEDYDRAVGGDWDVFITKGLARPVLEGTNTYYRKPIPDEAVRIYQRLLQQARAEIMSRVALQTEGTFELLDSFHLEYQRLKTALAALRFEDVTHYLARRGFSRGVDRLAFRLDGVVEHLLLDEFQDTSLTQWQVVRPFAQQVAAATDGSFFCVGDVKQAIYGWRGGVAEIFDALPNELPDLADGSLDVSYRSARPIIDVVNTAFAGMHRHPDLDRAEPEVSRWCGRFTPHETARTELAGYAVLQTSPEPEGGERQADATLRFAADEVVSQTQAAPGSSIGVLVRTNDAVAKLIYLLRKRHVHASEEGGNPLTDSAAVRIVLSLLTMADHPGNTVSRTHVAHSPLGKALGFEDGSDGESAVQLAQRVRRTLMEEGYGAAVYDWSRQLAERCNRRELSRLDQLVELAYGYQASATLRPSDFVQYVSTQRVSDPTAADVRVMTVHQSKGLQFDIVVLPDLDKGVIGQPDAFVVDREGPTSPVRGVCLYVNEYARRLLPAPVQQMFQAATDREVAESLCVLYVAMTRAVHALHMIVAPASPKEKKLRRTFAGLLRAALAEGQPAAAGTTLYQTGDPQWQQAAGRAAPVASKKGAVSPTEAGAPFEVRLAPASKRTRGLDRASPSGLEGGIRARVRAVFGLAEMGFAAARGTLWHGWMELVHWFEDGVPDETALRDVALQMPEVTAALDVDAQLASFQSLLTRPWINEVLRRRDYRPPRGLKQAGLQDDLRSGRCSLGVQNERRFAMREDDAVLTGFIDRLVLIQRDGAVVAADVTDYKTDAISKGSRPALEARVEYYRPQLAAYCRAVERFTGLASDRIAARLVFLEPGEVVDL